MINTSNKRFRIIKNEYSTKPKKIIIIAPNIKVLLFWQR